MSLNNAEQSRTLGQPRYLLLFRYGTAVGEVYAYTTAEQDVVHNTITYTPIPVSVGNIESSPTLDKKTLTVAVPLNAAVAELFRTYPPSYPVTLTIRRGHSTDPDSEYTVVWTGRVLSCSRDRSEAVMSCEPISTALRRAGLRRSYQYSCPHVLYGNKCLANKAARTTTVTVISLDNGSVTLANNWEPNDFEEKALGGLVEWTGPQGTVIRTVLEVIASNTLRLSGPTTGLEIGDTVDVSLGCNLRFELELDSNGTPTGNFVDTDCHEVHDNIQNYGGQPWIPTKNPINSNPYY